MTPEFYEKAVSGQWYDSRLKRAVIPFIHKYMWAIQTKDRLRVLDE